MWIKTIAAAAVAGPIALAAGAAMAETVEQTICVPPSSGPAGSRVIEITYLGDGPVPCRVHYTKNGTRAEIGHANNQTGFCERIANNVIGNLEAAAYSCRPDVGREDSSN